MGFEKHSYMPYDMQMQGSNFILASWSRKLIYFRTLSSAQNFTKIKINVLEDKHPVTTGKCIYCQMDTKMAAKNDNNLPIDQFVGCQIYWDG